MPALAAAIVTAFSLAMKFLIARALIVLGLQIAVVVGLDTLMDYAIQQAFANISNLDPVIYSIIARARIPDAIAVISAAAIVKHSLTYGAGKLIFVGRNLQG